MEGRVACRRQSDGYADARLCVRRSKRLRLVRVLLIVGLTADCSTASPAIRARV